LNTANYKITVKKQNFHTNYRKLPLWKRPTGACYKSRIIRVNDVPTNGLDVGLHPREGVNSILRSTGVVDNNTNGY